MPITFKKEFIPKILSGEKTRTTRYRKHAGVKVGGTYKAKTNRFAKEHFALLKVVAIRSAYASADSPFRRNAWTQNLDLVIGFARQQHHAEKEGFEDYHEFRSVYTELNAHHKDDMQRKHWIIDFGVVNENGEFIATKFRIGDWVSLTRYGELKTAQILEVDYSEWNQDWCYKLDSFVNDTLDFWDWQMEYKIHHAVNPNID